MFVVIEALIGAGKSTLCRSLRDEKGYGCTLEPVENNPYLKLYYENPERYALSMQVDLLNQRYHLHKKALFMSSEPGVSHVVADRSIYGDSVFLEVQKKQNFIIDLEYQTYHSLATTMMNEVASPDLLIYLSVTPEQARDRILSRGRDCEKDIPLSYLEALDKEYKVMLKNVNFPVITLDYSEFLPVDTVHEVISEFAKENERFYKHTRKLGDS